MLQQQSLFRAALLSGCGTSAHETGVASSFNTNPFRLWHPETQTRRRRPSDTAALRAELCEELRRSHPAVRRARLRDTGILFILRLRLLTGRTLLVKAYNLRNLRGLAAEALAGQ